MRVHDITLRDGEQEAGIVFRKDEKVRLAQALDEAGFDRIEAGMPVVSKEDAEAVKTIAHNGLNSKVFAFSRCEKSDVDFGPKADVDGLVMEVPSSEHTLLNPRSVAIVGATQDSKRHGFYETKEFLEEGFKGRTFPVSPLDNPKSRHV